ncbi:hypothetical protein S40288_00814 [Stachybotrys chartarum IBT 40288]|nr:hypothetical protein S40288_00814 [Stachybotrys chartarum IBT 40288]
MSLSARERANPPPRRKSCNACIKAKRRCDAAYPACLRCAQRSIPCEYPWRLNDVRARSSGPAVDSLLAELEKDLMPPIIGLSPLPSAIDPMAELLPEPEPVFGDVNPFLGAIDDVPMQLIPQRHWVDGLPDNISEHVAEAITKRIQWSLDEIKRAPSKMVLTGGTPWCHAQLYAEATPRSIRDAHACCGLYMAKNVVNGPFILRTIESHVTDLVATPVPSSPRELLARTQALVLYQIIRFFDGNISCRAAAERTVPFLEDCAMTLMQHVQFDNDPSAQPCELPLYPLAPTKAFWKDWVFHESARRTLLFTYYFLQTYRLLANPKELHACDGRLGLCSSWTLSAHLWNASTPLEFAKAWRDSKHFVVTNAQFGAVLQEAQADDVDAFGKIFITSLLGIEEAEGWLASRGGTL